MKKRVTIGTDPEFFLHCKNEGRLISAIPFIKGTKYEPEPLPQGGNFQRDNVALEFATDPAVDAEDLVIKIRNAFTDIKGKLPTHMSIIAVPAAEFDADQLAHPEAMMFGCDPDFNAWKLEQNTAPFVIESLRSCGGHFHVGHVPGDGCDFLLDDIAKYHVIRTMDLFHGVVSVTLDTSEEAHKRRTLYGKAGCFRPTPYGVEYRVMSNFWLKSPVLVNLMDLLLQQALDVLKKNQTHICDMDRLVGGYNIPPIEDISPEAIQKTINKGDVNSAEKLIEKALSPYLTDEIYYYLENAKEILANNKTIDEEWSIITKAKEMAA